MLFLTTQKCMTNPLTGNLLSALIMLCCLLFVTLWTWSFAYCLGWWLL